MQQTLKSPLVITQISSHANDIFSEKVLLSQSMPTHMRCKLKWHGSVVEGLGAKLACVQPWLATIETLNCSAAEELQKGKKKGYIPFFTVQMLVVNRRDDATNSIETYCFTICCFPCFQIIRHLKLFMFLFTFNTFLESFENGTLNKYISVVLSMCVLQEEAGHQASWGWRGCGGHPSQMFITGKNQTEVAGGGGGALHGPGEGRSRGALWESWRGIMFFLLNVCSLS